MAVRTMTTDFENFTVPANTSIHQINFDNILESNSRNPHGTAMIKWGSGTSIKFTANGADPDANTGTVTTSNDKVVLKITRGVPIKYQGGAGGFGWAAG